MTPFDFKAKGDFMKPFQSFYGPKQLEQPVPDTEAKRIAAVIARSLEDQIKQVRANCNETTTFHRSSSVSQSLSSFLDFVEDQEAGRLSEDKVKALQSKF